MKIVLCGFMGSGKTYIGKIISKKAGVKFLDMDYVIEKNEGMTVREIFEKKGEAYFRNLEGEVLKQLLQNDNVIIGSGGGTVLNPLNVKIANDLGAKILFLDVPLSALQERLKNDKKRPLLQREDRHEFIEKLYNERYGKYKSAADIKMSAGAPPITVANRIIKLINDGVIS